MPPRRQRFPELSGEEAIAALRWLVARRKIRAADIKDALRRREELIAEIKRRLEDLGGEGLRFLRGPEGLTPRRLDRPATEQPPAGVSTASRKRARKPSS